MADSTQAPRAAEQNDLGISQLDLVVLGLPSDERLDLLREIGRNKEEATFGETEDEVPVSAPVAPDLESEYQGLPWWRRLFLAIRAFFSGVAPTILVQDILLRRDRRRLAEVATDAVDMEKLGFTNVGYELFRAVQRSADLLWSDLRPALDRDRESFLVSFLTASLPDHVERMRAAVDMSGVDWKNAESPGRIVQKRMDALESILNGIPTKSRTDLYDRFRRLDAIGMLARFDWKGLYDRFGAGNVTSAFCPFSDAQSSFRSLASILLAVHPFPDERAIAVAGVFGGFQRGDTGDGTVAERALALRTALGELNRRLPASLVIPVLFDRLDVEVVPAGGGEDWFRLLLRYWQRSLTEAVRHAHIAHRIGELADEVEAETGESRPKPRSVTHFDCTLWAADGFMRVHYETTMRSALRRLYLDGEFYKDANRDEYNIAVEALQSIGDELSELSRRVAADDATAGSTDVSIGELRAVYDPEIDEMIRRITTHLRTIVEVLNGVLFAIPGGRYDSISNLDVLGGSEARIIRRQLEVSYNLAKRWVELLSELYDAENERRRRSSSEGL